MAPQPRLLATSDLHLSYRQNRLALADIGEHNNDWLIVAGDVAHSLEHVEYAWQVLTGRFARVIWSPGNHELWSSNGDAGSTRGDARYKEFVALGKHYGVLTPEDPYVEWPTKPGLFLVPMFLLYDYSFRPPDISFEQAVPWARASGVLCGDERLLDPAPWNSRSEWCHARCDLTELRLNQLPAGAETILVNHWPLRYDLARPPRIPRFSIWCGTTRTEDWARKYHARAVVSGHLHLRTTIWRHGVRYEEVSLGYPRDWHSSRGIDHYLREILPGNGRAAQRYIPARDPFFLTDRGIAEG